MTIDEAKELLLIERECVNRNNEHHILCDRNCEKCDLVQDADKIIEMYSNVAEWLEELKFYKEKDQKFIHLTEQEFADVYNKGRSDAIDEIHTELITEIAMLNATKMTDADLYTFAVRIKEITDKLKEKKNEKAYIIQSK